MREFFNLVLILSFTMIMLGGLLSATSEADAKFGLYLTLLGFVSGVLFAIVKLVWMRIIDK